MEKSMKPTIVKTMNYLFLITLNKYFTDKDYKELIKRFKTEEAIVDAITMFIEVNDDRKLTPQIEQQQLYHVYKPKPYYIINNFAVTLRKALPNSIRHAYSRKVNGKESTYCLLMEVYDYENTGDVQHYS